MATSPYYPILYLAPRLDPRLVDSSSLAPKKPGVLRVVCIADTHNEHESLSLPAGDLLVHAGDVLTESGRRHVKQSVVSEAGLKLFDRFAAWFGAQPHAHKLVIGGNHDSVFQGLGTAVVRRVFAEKSAGTALYVEHEGAQVGGLRVFGSPRARWGGANDAFLTPEPDFSGVATGTHIVVTHMPPVLPSSHGGNREDASVVDMLHRVGALLQVSGHCHWAHGAYSTTAAVPCVVASISGEWSWPMNLQVGPSRARGDPADRWRGGYNLTHPVIVADIEAPIPAPGDSWVILQPGHALAAATPAAPLPVAAATASTAAAAAATAAAAADALDSRAPFPSKPGLLLFCPPNDPGTSVRLERALRVDFDVLTIDSADEAVAAIYERAGRHPGASSAVTSASAPGCAADTKVSSSRRFAVCISKLGVRGNLGSDVMRALRETHGDACELIVHSKTARGNAATELWLRSTFGTSLVVDHESEAEMTPLLERARAAYEAHSATQSVGR